MVKFGVSIWEDLELVVSFKTSPCSLKTESGRNSYRVFCNVDFVVFQAPDCPTGKSPDSLPAMSQQCGSSLFLCRLSDSFMPDDLALSGIFIYVVFCSDSFLPARFFESVARI